MDRKTTMSPNGHRVDPIGAYEPRTPSHDKGGLAHHLIELGELQVKLLRTDFDEAVKATKMGSILIVLSAAFLIAVVPILLLSLTLGIEELFDLSRGISLLITGGVATLAGVLLLWSGWNIVQRGMGKMSRSRTEFKKNFKWLKELMSPHSHDHPSDALH
jgi:hypothetical protein